jgi:hypothetical protein
MANRAYFSMILVLNQGQHIGKTKRGYTRK